MLVVPGARGFSAKSPAFWVTGSSPGLVVGEAAVTPSVLDDPASSLEAGEDCGSAGCCWDAKTSGLGSRPGFLALEGTVGEPDCGPTVLSLHESPEALSTPSPVSLLSNITFWPVSRSASLALWESASFLGRLDFVLPALLTGILSGERDLAPLSPPSSESCSRPLMCIGDIGREVGLTKRFWRIGAVGGGVDEVDASI